jgi:hypothetical protein
MVAFNSLSGDIYAASIHPEVVQAVSLCLVTAEFELLEARLVIAGAFYDVLEYDLVVLSCAPGMR